MSSFTELSKAAVAAAATDAGEVVHHIRRLSSSSSEDGKRWSPFKNEFDFRLAAFGATMVTVLVGLCILHVIIRCCTCFNHPDEQASFQPTPRRILPLMSSFEPALIFTNGLTLAGGTDHPECAICLSEFVEGDEIRILSNCRHGFHPKCIETWLQSSGSSACPTCRSSCVETSVNQNSPENQQQQQQQQQVQNDFDLEAANQPAIEMMVLQQQQQTDAHEAVIVVLQEQQQQRTAADQY